LKQVIGKWELMNAPYFAGCGLHVEICLEWFGWVQSNLWFQVLVHNYWFKEAFEKLKTTFCNFKLVRPILHGWKIAFLKFLMAESKPPSAYKLSQNVWEKLHFYRNLLIYNLSFDQFRRCEHAFYRQKSFFANKKRYPTPS